MGGETGAGRRDQTPRESPRRRDLGNEREDAAPSKGRGTLIWRGERNFLQVLGLTQLSVASQEALNCPHLAQRREFLFPHTLKSFFTRNFLIWDDSLPREAPVLV